MDLGYGFLNNLWIINIICALCHNVQIMGKLMDFSCLIHELFGKNLDFHTFQLEFKEARPVFQ